MNTDRRRFLHSAAGMGASLAWAQQGQPPVDLPKVKFRNRELTRLLIGSNPFYGYSHFNGILDRCMREWYTQDRRIEVLKHAERTGINTWQVHYNDACMEDWKRYRDEGGKMNVLVLADFALMKDLSLMPAVAKLGPIGIAHHGNRSDDRLRDGQMNLVHDFLKAVHDTGLPAGVSCHNPAVVEYVEERGWASDFYMTCMYRVSRTDEEKRKEFGEAMLGESFMERDPERMCAVVRKVKKTCFAFKVMGAGRNDRRIEDALRYVLSNVKPQDPIIVGMFPKFKDEVRENAEFVRKICTA
jgi:hypothetical protein